MKIKTQSTITITLSGAEATELANWLHSANAGNDNRNVPAPSYISKVASDLLIELRALPEETLE